MARAVQACTPIRPSSAHRALQQGRRSEGASEGVQKALQQGRRRVRGRNRRDVPQASASCQLSVSISRRSTILTPISRYRGRLHRLATTLELRHPPALASMGSERADGKGLWVLCLAMALSPVVGAGFGMVDQPGSSGRVVPMNGSPFAFNPVVYMVQPGGDGRNADPWAAPGSFGAGSAGREGAVAIDTPCDWAAFARHMAMIGAACCSDEEDGGGGDDAATAGGACDGSGMPTGLVCPADCGSAVQRMHGHCRRFVTENVLSQKDRLEQVLRRSARAHANTRAHTFCERDAECASIGLLTHVHVRARGLVQLASRCEKAKKDRAGCGCEQQVCQRPMEMKALWSTGWPPSVKCAFHRGAEHRNHIHALPRPQTPPRSPSWRSSWLVRTPPQLPVCPQAARWNHLRALRAAAGGGGGGAGDSDLYGLAGRVRHSPITAQSQLNHSSIMASLDLHAANQPALRWWCRQWPVTHCRQVAVLEQRDREHRAILEAMQVAVPCKPSVTSWSRAVRQLNSVERCGCRGRYKSFSTSRARYRSRSLQAMLPGRSDKRPGTSLCTCLYTRNHHKWQVHFQSLD